MIDAKKELQYRLAVRMLEPAEHGRTVLRQETGQREIFPADCLGIVLDILRIVW